MAEQILATRRISRFTVRRAVPAVKVKPAVDVIREDVAFRLQLIAEAQAEIDALQEKIALNTASIEKSLREAELPGVTTGVWTAEIVDDISRAARTPDPQKVYKRLGATEFFKIIKVSTTELKGHLTDKEIDALSSHVPAKKLGTKLKITRKKK